MCVCVGGGGADADLSQVKAPLLLSFLVQASEMAEKDGQAPAAPPSDSHSVLQERLSQASLDPNGDPVVQPFPRSPNLQRKMTRSRQPSQVGSCKFVHDIHEASRRPTVCV